MEWNGVIEQTYLHRFLVEESHPLPVEFDVVGAILADKLPKRLRDEVLNGFIALDNEAQGGELTWTVADDLKETRIIFHD